MNLISLFVCTAFLLMGSFGHSQPPKDCSTCEGTINIFSSNTFDVQFIGSKGKTTVFQQYPALNKISSGNQIWFSFVAPTDGRVEMTISSKQTGLNLIVFSAENKNVCDEIAFGNAIVERMIVPPNSNKIGLDTMISEKFSLSSFN